MWGGGGLNWYRREQPSRPTAPQFNMIVSRDVNISDHSQIL